MNPDPFQAFAELYELAKDAYPEEPNAAVLATVGEDGRPSARVVLLKGFSPEGFVFYTIWKAAKAESCAPTPSPRSAFTGLAFTGKYEWKGPSSRCRMPRPMPTSLRGTAAAKLARGLPLRAARSPRARNWRAGSKS